LAVLFLLSLSGKTLSLLLIFTCLS